MGQALRATAQPPRVCYAAGRQAEALPLESRHRLDTGTTEVNESGVVPLTQGAYILAHK